MTDTDRYQKLLAQLASYAYEYYVLDEPSVSDAVYDGLIRELKQIEAAHPEMVSPASPTQRVGGEPLAKFQKVPHSAPMISLNDVFSREEVQAWVNRMDKLLPGNKHEFFCDLKMDGLSCALIYQNGVLKQAATRGDGRVGEDVTQNARTIANIPLKLRVSAKTKPFLRGRTEIRGEIVMLKTDFEKLNKQREDDGLAVFANPRNLSAGTMRQLDPKLVAARKLHFRAYEILRDDPAEIPTNGYAYETIRSLGLTANPQASVMQSLDEVMKFVDKWADERHKLPFITDGLVVKINDREIYQKLGVVGKNPRAAVAYKYPAEQATTLVKDIVISIGRTGAATPVAVFDPVVVAGTTVQHASLHNADEIERKDVRVGDTVVIYKAGDIIPQVEEVITKLRPKSAKKFVMAAELKRQYPELEFVRPEGEVVWRVKGLTGPLILKKAVEHYASKGALDIEGLGEKNVAALVDAKLAHDLSDIYTLSKDDVLALERFADVSASKLVAGIAAAKHPELYRFVYGLGIRHVGVQTAIDLSQQFGSIEHLQHATLEQLQSVDGVGDVVAESILAWFSDSDNIRLLEKFERLGVAPQKTLKLDGPLTGKSFVVTGTLESMGRDQAAERIRTLGGTFQTSVASDTTYLVVGANTGQSKLNKAAKLGVEQIDEVKFLQIVGGA